MPRELVDNGMVLPVIDGLDELDPAYRSVTAHHAERLARQPPIRWC